MGQSDASLSAHLVRALQRRVDGSSTQSHSDMPLVGAFAAAGHSYAFYMAEFARVGERRVGDLTSQGLANSA